MKKIYHLAVEATLEVISGKWKPMILCHLGNGAMRTGELKRNIPAISQRMLTLQLRELENDQIVVRKVFNQVPPKVEYSLTETGESLRDLLLSMSEWGERLIEKKQEEGIHVEILSKEYDGFKRNAHE